MKTKRIVSLLLSFILLMSLMSGFAAADGEMKCPFEIKAPVHVSLYRSEEFSDSPTTMDFSYSMDNEMLKFIEKLEKAKEEGKDLELLAEYGLSDFGLVAQIDWAIDDVNDPVSGWHYNEFWEFNKEFNRFGVDKDGNERYSEWDIVDEWTESTTVDNLWILRGMPNDERWNGNPETKKPGVKDQLNLDQYTYDTVNEELTIDWTKHTAYARARFVVIGFGMSDDAWWEPLAVSDWSETASWGADAEKVSAITKDDLPAPELTDLHLTDKDFNGLPVAAFTLTVPDELAEKATMVASVGGMIRVETYARVQGDKNWIEMGNTDSDVKTGELECALVHLINDDHPEIDANTPIEVRCRYYCYQGELGDDVYSEYSEIASFETSEMKPEEQITPTPVEDKEEEKTPVKEEKKEEEKKKKCPICHFCPQPLGICIFIWLVIIIVVAIVIIVIVKNKNKKDNQANKN